MHPPPRPFTFSIVVDGVRVALSTPAVVVLLALAAFVPGVVTLLKSSPTEPTLTALSTAPSPLVLGALPRPAPNQRKAGECTPGVEAEINGGCWLATDRKPPCPPPTGPWVFYEHAGKCWVPVAQVPRVPTSGAPRTEPVAGQD